MVILIIFAIFICIIAVKILFRPYQLKRKYGAFEQHLLELTQLVNNQQYEEASKMLRENSILSHWQLAFLRKQHRDVIDLEIKVLEKTGRLSEAVINLAFFLAGTYKMNTWPEDLLFKWVSLYKLCDPIPIEKFYFCPDCGMDNYTNALLKIAVRAGGQFPVGYTDSASKELGGERKRVDGRNDH